MTKTEYAEYLNSENWRLIRTSTLRQTSWCERCYMPRWLAAIAYEQDLNVHHLSYANLGAESIVDLEVLCRHCHEIETFGRTDLRAPKFSDCTACGMVHWNPYSDLCNSCRDVQEASYTHPGLLFLFDRHKRQVWETMVRNLAWAVGVDRVLEELKEVEIEIAQARKIQFPTNDDIHF